MTGGAGRDGTTAAAERRQRIVDAARILPFAGAILMMLPLAWEPAPGAPARDTARDTIYLFALWAALIGAAAVLAPALRRVAAETDAGTGAGRDDG
jgi:hypothetical protein